MTTPNPLPRFSLSMMAVVGGTHRAFEVGDDSMLPILPGTTIVARYADDWAHVPASSPCIVVSQKDGIQFKRLRFEGGELVLASDNPLYTPTRLSLHEVLEIWEARAYISNVMPPASMTLDGLSDMARELTEQVKTMQLNRA